LADVDVLEEVEGSKGLSTFVKEADGLVLLFSSEVRGLIVVSLFNIINDTKSSNDPLPASDGCEDAGLSLPGSDRETHLSRPLLGVVAAKSAADEELTASGSAFEEGSGGVRHLENEHDFWPGVSESCGIDGLAERDIEDAEETFEELEVSRTDRLPSRVDGPGPAGPSPP
jgi:hypothetical protein